MHLNHQNAHSLYCIKDVDRHLKLQVTLLFQKVTSVTTVADTDDVMSLMQSKITQDKTL